MFIERLLITIIIIMYGLAFDPGILTDLRQWVQNNYRDRSVESRNSRFFNSKFSSEVVLGKFSARTLDP